MVAGHLDAIAAPRPHELDTLRALHARTQRRTPDRCGYHLTGAKYFRMIRTS